MGVMMGLGFPHRVTVFIGADGRLLEIDRSPETKNAGERLLERLEALGIPKKA